MIFAKTLKTESKLTLNKAIELTVSLIQFVVNALPLVCCWNRQQTISVSFYYSRT